MDTERPDVLSIDEAADYLRIDAKAIVRMAREKKIGSLKIGRIVTFPRIALEEYVAENTVKASSNRWGLTDAAAQDIRNSRLTTASN